MQKARKGAWTTKKKIAKKKIANLISRPKRRKEGTKEKEGRREGGRNEGRKKGKGKKTTEYVFFDAFEQLDLP